jgi:outer membrane protein assembly factor BamA
MVREIIQPYLDFVHDNVVWGVTGPVNGERARLLGLYSPRVSGNSLDFQTLIADGRKYYRLQRKYNLVLRLSTGQSFGRDKQDFYLGGTRNCLFGPGITAGVMDEDLWSLENFYFGNYVAPLRGIKFYDMRGKGYLLANLEFRYPFINYLVIDWPLGVVFRQVRGALFLDAATVWDQLPDFSKFRFTSGIPRHDELTTQCGLGFGGRLNIGFTVLRLDIAWQTDFNRIAHKPHYYFSLGGEF